MKGYAIGYMNMTMTEWRDSFLGEICLKLRYFMKKREEDKIILSELVRLQTLELININLAQKDKLKAPTDLWKFAWDKQNVEVEVEEETMKNRINEVKKIWQSN